MIICVYFTGPIQLVVVNGGVMVSVMIFTPMDTMGLLYGLVGKGSKSELLIPISFKRCSLYPLCHQSYSHALATLFWAATAMV